tara:strand:+ start:39 stop:710 length:672 start_codon:yes stop_codon:yes gene_type:complete
MKCLICGKDFKYINNTHLKNHNITCDEYRKKFNVKRLRSEEHSKIISLNGKKNKGRKHSEKVNKSKGRVGRAAWNKGLTKENNAGMKSASEKKKGMSPPNKGVKNPAASKRLKERIRKGEWFKGQNKNTKPELQVAKILKENNIKYSQQYRIDTRLYDFHLPEYNILLEVDGVYWHCKNDDNRPNNWKERIEIDEMKNQMAIKNGFKMVRVWSDEIDLKWRVV